MFALKSFSPALSFFKPDLVLTLEDERNTCWQPTLKLIWLLRQMPLWGISGRARANGRQGCVIWAEFVQTRVGYCVAYPIFFWRSKDQFLFRKNRTQTWPNDSTLPHVSSGAFRFHHWAELGSCLSSQELAICKGKKQVFFFGIS